MDRGNRREGIGMWGGGVNKEKAIKKRMTGKYFIDEENSRKFAISRKEKRRAEILQLRFK